MRGMIVVLLVSVVGLAQEAISIQGRSVDKVFQHQGASWKSFEVQLVLRNRTAEAQERVQITVYHLVEADGVTKVHKQTIFGNYNFKARAKIDTSGPCGAIQLRGGPRLKGWVVIASQGATVLGTYAKPASLAGYAPVLLSAKDGDEITEPEKK